MQRSVIAALVVGSLVSSWAVASDGDCRVTDNGELMFGEQPGIHCAPDRICHNKELRLVFNDLEGKEVQSPREGVFAVRVYRKVSGQELRKALEKGLETLKPSVEDVRCLQRQWTSNVAGNIDLSQTCNTAVLQALHTKLLIKRRGCGEPKTLIARAQCSWLDDALALTTSALKPVGEHSELKVEAQCAALAAHFTSDSGQCEVEEVERFIDAKDDVVSLDQLVSKTEIAWGEADNFRHIEFNESETLVSPALEMRSWVAVKNYPHAHDADIEWQAIAEDPVNGLKTAAGFVGFAIASYARQTISIPTASNGSPEPLKLAQREGVTLGQPEAHEKLGPIQRFLDRLPPVIATGTRFLGPILPQPDTRYRLSLLERSPAGKKRTTVSAAQTINYLPRYSWLVTVTGGLAMDTFFNETAEDPVFEHKWIPAEVGPTSTSFVRESTPLLGRRLVPYLGLVVSPPWRPFNHDAGRVFFQLAAGVPLDQPRGVAHWSLGGGWWWRNLGFTMSLAATLRVYDQPISKVGRAQLVLANPATAPTIGTRAAVAGGVSLQLGVDLGKIGGAFVDAVKPLFGKEAK